jgi:hypothetical protein
MEIINRNTGMNVVSVVLVIFESQTVTSINAAKTNAGDRQ